MESRSKLSRKRARSQSASVRRVKVLNLKGGRKSGKYQGKELASAALGSRRSSRLAGQAAATQVGMDCSPSRVAHADFGQAD
jgi:hypothetical protein